MGENPDAVEDYKAGTKKALNFLMGKVMAKMKGRADSKVVTKLLAERI